MNSPRLYGKPPFSVAVLHGGPGAPGYMAPVAKELSSDLGVLEPLQTATSVDGQVQELRAVVLEYADPPATLIGSSWGAMLGFIFAACYPKSIKKLIMIGSGAFEDKYAQTIEQTRLDRLTEEERQEARSLMKALGDPTQQDKDIPFARLAALFTKADAYDPLTLDLGVLEHQYHVYETLWKNASELRCTGELLELGKRIGCPVVAIHGDYDPHPAEGVEKPLAAVLKDFRFVLLKNCGHLPWIEREARDSFYAVLREELR